MADMDKYVIARMDAFEDKLDVLFERFEARLERHTKDDREQFAEVSQKLYEMNGAVSGLKVKASIFGVVGGLLASMLVLFKSIFTH